MATPEEKAEEARRHHAEQQAAADRERELAWREVREQAAAEQVSVIAHSPVQS